MKKESKRYYISTFIMALAFVLILNIITHAGGNYLISNSLEMEGVWAQEFEIFLYKGKTFIVGNYVLDVVAIFAFPLFFVFIFWLVDFLVNKLKSKKRKAEEEAKMKYDEFINEISRKMNESNAFNVEDYRHFRENQKFQETLKKLYMIYSEGENENLSYVLLERKFRKGTKEKEAIDFLIAFTKEKRAEKEITVTPEEKEEKNEQL